MAQAPETDAASITMKSGSIVRVGPWHGIIAHVCESPERSVALIMFVKNVIKSQPPEWVEMNVFPPVQLSTPGDLVSEYNETMGAIKKKFKEMINGQQ